MTEPKYPLVIVETTPDESDVMIGRLTLLGAEGIEERDATTLTKGGPSGVTLVASFATFELAEEAAREIGSTARLDEIVGDAWRDGWREHWRPTRLGSRIVVVPSWMEYAAETHDLVMRLDPGRAFGTGQHASTALVSELLEQHIHTADGATILDVGCGSGILSFAALLLGTPRAIACDLDPDAVAAARENSVALGLEDRIDLRVGTVDVVIETSRLVVANIEAVVLIPIAHTLSQRVASGGTLILSGILSAQLSSVRDAYEKAGLMFAGVNERDGWVAPYFSRKS